MSHRVRELNDAGIEAFAAYIDRVRAGSTESPPLHLLSDSGYSIAPEFEATVEQRSFTDFFELGSYLVGRLTHVDRHIISLHHGLWTWLALFYLDHLASPAENGCRKFHRPEYYVLTPRSPYTRYYKHFVRIAWLTCSIHGEFAKLLLIQSRSGKTNDYRELLTGSQDRVENRTIVETAYRLYFDTDSGKPKARASGQSGAGTIHRFSDVLRQFDRTFDLLSCSVGQLLTMLPKEFDSFKPKMGQKALSRDPLSP
jgi:hypothetical protein